MKIALLGANGQLGFAFQSFFQELNDSSYELFSLSKSNLDLTDKNTVDKVMEKMKPDLVINAAAFTDVDVAESADSKNIDVNYEAVVNLGMSLSKKPAWIIHFSTDYVFSSNKLKYFKTDDETCPINRYGSSKSNGEKALRELVPESSTIIRTAWLYGNSKKNFVNKIVEKAKLNQQIEVVDDQFGQPTWTKDLVAATFSIMENNIRSGIYHVTGLGVASRYQLACQIYEFMNADVSNINPIKTQQNGLNAPRPKYSCLDLSYWFTRDLWKPIDWKISLAEYLKLIT